MVAIIDVIANITTQQRYLPFGQTRTLTGFSPITATDFAYTGQRTMDGMGLLDYKFRFYDPLLMRFISPDDIIPDQSNPQTWNRYSYGGNGPIVHSDPTGHCFDPVCLAALGFVIGFSASVILQVAVPVFSGKSNFSDAFSAVDWKKAVVYGVAGAVTGATYGAINPAETIAGAAVAGGIAGMLGGQAGAVAKATIDTGSEIVSSSDPLSTTEKDLTNEGWSKWYDDAHQEGLLDPKKMLLDTASGAVLAGTTQGLVNAFTLPQGGTYVTTSAREAHTILPRLAVPAFKSALEFGQETIQQYEDGALKRYGIIE